MGDFDPSSSSSSSPVQNLVEGVQGVNVNNELSAMDKLMAYGVEPQVLTKIASKLPIADQLKIRSTAGSWNDAIISSIRVSHPPIQLTNVKPIPQMDGWFVERPIGTVYKYPSITPWHWKTGSPWTMAIRGDNGKDSLKHFNDMMRSSVKVPFGAFDLWLEPQMDECPDLDEFVMLCGPSMRSLRLEARSDYIFSKTFPVRGLDMDLVRQLVFEKLPTLASLEILLDHREPTHYESQLMKAVPKLQQLTINCSTLIPHPAQEAFLTDLSKSLAGLTSLEIKSGAALVRHLVGEFAPNLTNLRRLKLSEPANSGDLSHLNQLTQRKLNSLHLSSFSVAIKPDLSKDTDFANQLYEFLVAQSGSLRLLELKTHLTLEMHKRRSDPDAIPRIVNSKWIRIPRMEKLQEFSLIRRGEDRTRFLQYDALTMENSFPNLKKLAYDTLWYDPRAFWHDTETTEDKVDEPDEASGVNAEVEASSHYCVTTMELNIDLPRVDGQILLLNQLGGGFLAMTYLHLSMSIYITRTIDGSLATLWSLSPRLESAHIIYKNRLPNPNLNGSTNTKCALTYDLDAALSGVPALAAGTNESQLVSNLRSSTTSLENVRALFQQLKTGPALCDVPTLRSLVLDFSQLSWTPSLGDVGGYFGLATANPGLQHFEIIRSSTLVSPGTASSSSSPPATNTISSDCEAMIRAALGQHAVLHF